MYNTCDAINDISNSLSQQTKKTDICKISLTYRDIDERIAMPDKRALSLSVGK